MGSAGKLHGVLVALTTPFTDDGVHVDESRLKVHISHLLDAGVHGLVPGGTTGEFTTMTVEERKHLLELVLKYAAGKVPVVAGVGALSTKDTVGLAEHAAEVGAAALMIVPPFYDAVNYEQLQEYLRDVHEASRLPIVYYHIPSASGCSLSPNQIASLSDVGVRYLKDTSGNAPEFLEVLYRFPNKVTAFNGWDTLTFSALAAGAQGTVWGASNLIPELSVQLWEAIVTNQDLNGAQKLWQKIWPICKFLETHNYPSAIKTGQELLGYPAGSPRKPFALLSKKHREELRLLLQDAGLQTV